MALPWSDNNVFPVSSGVSHPNYSKSSSIRSQAHFGEYFWAANSDGARCLKVEVLEKSDLPEAFSERRMCEFGGEL